MIQAVFADNPLTAALATLKRALFSGVRAPSNAERAELRGISYRLEAAIRNGRTLTDAQLRDFIDGTALGELREMARRAAQNWTAEAIAGLDAVHVALDCAVGSLDDTMDREECEEDIEEAAFKLRQFARA